MKNFGDITKIRGSEVPIVDIVTGGSPCQDLSVAGTRKGLQHSDLGDEETTRSGLFMEQIRVVKEMRNECFRQLQLRGADVDFRLLKPRFLVWENVPGALSSPGKESKGKDFQAVLTEIVRIVRQNAPDVPLPNGGRWSKSGCLMGIGDNGQPFSIAWRVHDAQFWGVPQRRKRISLVADFGELSAPEILFERKSVSGDFEQSEQKGQGTSDTVGTGVEESSTAYTLKIRGGREIDSLGHRAGKGALVQKEKSGTLGVSQDQTLIQTGSCIGFDAYNQSSTGEVSKSLNSISTDSDHVPLVFKNEENVSCYRKTAHPRNPEEGQGWEETEVNDTLNIFDNGETRTSTLIAHGFDSYNLQETGEVGRILTTPTGGLNEHIPVIIDNHATDSRCKICEDNVVPTLASRMGTGGNNVPLVMEEPMLLESSLQHASIRTDGISATLTAIMGTGGNNVPMIIKKEEPILLESNQNHATVQTDGISTTLPASMGMGGGYVPMVTDEVAGTLDASYYKGCGERNGVEREVVVSQAWDGSQVSPTLTANNANGAQRMPDKDNFNAVIQNGTYQKVTGSLMASGYDKLGTQEAMNDMYVSNKSIVRRLTPLECERLQGFPDGWTDIGDWTDSSGKKHKGDADSPRYKALGNSIALPFWQWMAKRMVNKLKEDGVDNPTMASLFSGIGGFEFVYKRAGCEPMWSSEIEEFPIAVCKKHFGDEDASIIKGDIEKYL